MMRVQPAFFAACTASSPIIPLPTTTAESPSRSGRQVDGVDRHRNRFDHRRLLVAERVRQPVHDAPRDGDVLRECAVPPVRTGRYAEHLTVVAQVHLAARAVEAAPAIYGGIEGDPVARASDRLRWRRFPPLRRRPRGPSPAAECAAPSCRPARGRRCRRCRTRVPGPARRPAPIAGTGISTISRCMYCLSKSAFIATKLSSHDGNREPGLP